VSTTGPSQNCYGWCTNGCDENECKKGTKNTPAHAAAIEKNQVDSSCFPLNGFGEMGLAILMKVTTEDENGQKIESTIPCQSALH
jgi:hypothetical protein